MIERHWKGIAKRERANEYIAHLQNETFRQIATISGFISAKILKREVKEGVEFLIITEWKNFDAIKSFAGLKIDKAVVPKLVQDIMIQYDDTVSHYETYYKTKAD
jgi:heme-degrading monooxygenase HmoA